MFTLLSSTLAITLLRDHQSSNCQKYSNFDCREYDIQTIPTDGVENYMTIGNESNMPPELAQVYGGLWYMNGNPLADEIASFAGSVKQPDGSYHLKVYDQGVWSFDDNADGRKLYDFVRTTGLVYKVTKENETTYHADAIFHLPQYLSGITFETNTDMADFDIIKTEDPNLWIRRTSFLKREPSDYRFTRIVYANGTRTEKYASDYLPNIDKKASGITLGKYQLISKLKPYQ